MKRIIVIDDDPGIQEAFALIFSTDLYEVIGYENGNVVLNNQCPKADIYVIDKQLSGIDGLDVCRFLKGQSATKDIPVIMFSSSPNIHVIAKLAGATDTLEKPFSIRVMRAMVEKYVSA